MHQLARVGRLSVSVGFNHHDLWVGAYWRHHNAFGYHWTHLYVCLIPMLPVRLSWFWDTWQDDA